MNFDKNTTKEDVFSSIRNFIDSLGFSIEKEDMSRPWGGFFVLDENQAGNFIKEFFPTLSADDFIEGQKLSPKILVVAPNKRLSWQYHFRRAEIWRVIGGNAAIVISDTDEETEQKQLPLGTLISLKQGERHRLVGTEEWGIVAEIWKHIDADNPSDEDDIVRVQDDFGR